MAKAMIFIVVLAIFLKFIAAGLTIVGFFCEAGHATP